MSKSAPITLASEELRRLVTECLGRPVLDNVWARAEAYARMKLDHCRERDPEVTYYDDHYLVLLTTDTVRETEYSDILEADCLAKQARERGSRNRGNVKV